jgi:large subunit ribosomal protein L6
MSKIGKKPVIIPEGVVVNYEGGTLFVKGPKGELARRIPEGIELKQEDDRIKIASKAKDKISNNTLSGTLRSNIANMVVGVSEGWSKKLELVGVGYRAEVSGAKLTMALGFSHPVVFEAPAGIGFKIEKNIITVEGADKDLVGLVADKIRSVKPPEPYKGKGIKYLDEIVRRKAGKAAKTQGVSA